MDGQISLRSGRADQIQPHLPQPCLTTLHKKKPNPKPSLSQTNHSTPLFHSKKLTMSPVTALLAGAAAPLPTVASRRPYLFVPARCSPVPGGCALAVECSSRPQKKATKHHMKTRPKKSQPWDIKRRPTQYPPLPPLPPDWTLVAAGATVDASAQGEEVEEPEPVAAPVVEVVAAPAAAD